MPNRIIKESIRTSKTVNAMTDFQFRVWIYLITYVDDYGRGSADPELIKGFVFPRRKRISESDIEKTLAELAGMGCISLYDVDGESYFCFPNWGKHQRIQTKKSKFPAPVDGHPLLSTVNHGESPPESEYEYESEYGGEKNKRACARDGEARAENDRFDVFWDAYPRKSGYIDKAYQEYRFAIENGATLDEMLAALEWQRIEWDAQSGRYAPSAEKWLHNRGWTQKRMETRARSADGSSIQSRTFYDVAEEMKNAKNQD